MCCRTLLWRTIDYFFDNLVPPSVFPTQIELSFLVSSLHASALLDFEHIES